MICRRRSAFAILLLMRCGVLLMITNMVVMMMVVKGSSEGTATASKRSREEAVAVRASPSGCGGVLQRSPTVGSVRCCCVPGGRERDWERNGEVISAATAAPSAVAVDGIAVLVLRAHRVVGRRWEKPAATANDIHGRHYASAVG